MGFLKGYPGGEFRPNQDVAAITAAGIVVNYPDRRMLNPTRPATRGEVAALIHQALVSQGKTAPIADQPVASICGGSFVLLRGSFYANG